MREAILRELARGGQVFYVYNRVESIGHVAEKLRKLVPTARIGVGHGQMTESELEPIMMNGNRLRDLRPAIERVFAKRKSKVGMAMLIGPSFVLKWLTKSLTIKDLERKIESMLGCTGSAVRGAPFELAYDIDDLEDFDYAMKHVGART